MRIALDGRMFRQRFENGAHIANRHFFIEQILQHFMQCGKRDDARNEIFRQLWHLLGDAIQQLLCLLTTKQLCGMLANEVVKMRCHHRAGLNHGVPLNLRLFFKRTFNPDSIQAKCRINGRFTR